MTLYLLGASLNFSSLGQEFKVESYQGLLGYTSLQRLAVVNGSVHGGGSDYTDGFYVRFNLVQGLSLGKFYEDNFEDGIEFIRSVQLNDGAFCNVLRRKRILLGGEVNWQFLLEYNDITNQVTETVASDWLDYLFLDACATSDGTDVIVYGQYSVDGIGNGFATHLVNRINGTYKRVVFFAEQSNVNARFLSGILPYPNGYLLFGATGPSGGNSAWAAAIPPSFEETVWSKSYSNGAACSFRRAVQGQTDFLLTIEATNAEASVYACDELGDVTPKFQINLADNHNFSGIGQDDEGIVISGNRYWGSDIDLFSHQDVFIACLNESGSLISQRCYDGSYDAFTHIGRDLLKMPDGSWLLSAYGNLYSETDGATHIMKHPGNFASQNGFACVEADLDLSINPAATLSSNDVNDVILVSTHDLLDYGVPGSPSGRYVTSLCTDIGITEGRDLEYGLYPEPHTNEFIVSGYPGVPYRLDLLAMDGRVVQSTRTPSLPVVVNTASLAPGRYVVRLIDRHGSIRTFPITKLVQ